MICAKPKKPLVYLQLSSISYSNIIEIQSLFWIDNAVCVKIEVDDIFTICNMKVHNCT